MKAVLFVALTLLFAGIVSSSTVCEDMSGNNIDAAKGFLSQLVSGTFGGALADDSLKIYFNSTKPSGSTDWTDPELTPTLAQKLIDFFYIALQCPDWALVAANHTDLALSNAQLLTVHASMGITNAEFDAFNAIIIGLVSQGTDNDTQIEIIYSALNGTRDGIVSRDSICDKYSDDNGWTNFELVTAIVDAVVDAEVANAGIKPYFDGTKPAGSVNYLAGTTAANNSLATLKGKLVNFFGGALGCSDPDTAAGYGKPTYSFEVGGSHHYSGDLAGSHQSLGITVAEFNTFNDILVATIEGLGVSAADGSAVRTVLDGTQSAIVATVPSTPTAGPASASTIVISLASVFVAVLAFLF